MIAAGPRRHPRYHRPTCQRLRYLLGTLALATGCETTEPETGTPRSGLASRPSNTSCLAPPRVPPAGTEGLPARLSDTGCFDAEDPTRPLPALIPYDVNAPLWSDGAAKQRWLALPDGARIKVDADGDFELPPRTVTIKTFSLGGRPIETRFFVHGPSGQWSGYTYEWNEAASDAVLLDEGAHRRPLASGQWHHPSRAECLKCHTAEAGYSLGLEIAQLNRSFDYGGGRLANQLTTFAHIGLFDQSPGNELDRLPSLPSPDDRQLPLENRARAYLHANCSSCHRPGDDEPGLVDFRFATPFGASMACDAEPLKGSLGLGPQMRIIAPGSADDSMVVERMKILESGRMPAVASLLVDEQGVSLLSEWIGLLTACP
jgi:uncharacterized repeat protein (TIGR03806 family)